MKQWTRMIGRTIMQDWYQKLSYLFIGFMMILTLSIFDGYWWDETFSIAYATLLLAMVIDLLLPLRSRVVRVILQAVLIIAATTKGTELNQPAWRPEDWRGWLLRLWHYAEQLHPYIWISLTLLIIYWLFSSWVTTKQRVFGFIGVNIISLTIADSFTPIWLWDEVAWIVFLGLLWLVATHLHRLEIDHPVSWREMLEYPLQLLLPITIVLTLLMSIGLLMPTISPILQDPYTLWRESKGETVYVFLGDKGNVAPSGVSSGDASSGYGRNDSQLGGGFNFDYSPVMTVTTSNRSYWRGETKSMYSGSGWSDIDEFMGLKLPPTASIQKDEVLPLQDERPLAETIKVKQQVTMIRKDPYPVLFGASPITVIHEVNQSELALPKGLIWSPSTLELQWSSTSKRKFPSSYSIMSEVTILDEAALRETFSGWQDKSKNEPYIQLPEELPTRVRKLAEQLTAGATNDYDRAKLLETYLRTNFIYTNKPDLTKLTGSSTDFVDQFLFELQEGYCDYFSTTMAVMSRSLGLPTRWVKGFAPGSLPSSEYYGGGMRGTPDEIDMNPNGEGTYTVRNSDAHSWVEIYFDGFGWIPFEATSGFTFPYTLQEETQAELPDLSTDTEEEIIAAPTQSKFSLAIGLWSFASILFVTLLVWMIIRREALIASLLKFKFRSYSADERIVWETEKLLRKCRKKGLERAEHETLSEAVFRWSSSRRLIQAEFREVLNGFERAKYSSVESTDRDVERFILQVSAIIKQL